MNFKCTVLVQLTFVVFCCFTVCTAVAKDDVVKLIEEEGYICEVHRVETSDGYLLKIHRVMKKEQGESPQLGVVFIMHGIYATSADFVITRSKIALAYYLVDNGYDVWLGNSRGNKYGMKHKTLKVNTRKFWTFSWHEIGVFDLPVMIDYTLNATNKEKVFYVAHSQGTTALIVLLCMLPEYNDKIIQAHLMAPAVFMTNTPSQLVRQWGAELLDFIEISGMYQSIPLMELVDKLSKLFCTPSFPPTLSFCANMLFVIAGYNQYEIELDTSILSHLAENTSPQISIMQFTHFVQSMLSGKFRQYDYKKTNMKIYNSTSPPEYDLNNVKVAIYLYHGEDDAIVSILDVENLRTKLANVRDYQIINNWNHLDFDYSKNARSVLYSSILESFNNETIEEKTVSSIISDE